MNLHESIPTWIPTAVRDEHVWRTIFDIAFDMLMLSRIHHIYVRYSSSRVRKQTKKHDSNRLLSTSTQISLKSPIDTIRIGAHHQVFVKRDDLLGTRLGEGGNKIRKLLHFRRVLLESPHCHSYKSILSYGGNQSNAMLATAMLAKDAGLQFDYFTNPPTSAALAEPHSNLRAALELGMNLHSVADVEQSLNEFRNTHDMTHILDLPRGVSCNEAELGLKELACELYEHFSQLSKPSFSVFLPSGTGTTAFFLNRHLQLLSRESGHSATTYGVSVAMKPEDLLRTIQDKYPDEPLGYPNFVHPTKTRIRFAKPHPSVKAIWCAMKRKGLLLDLIYGPVAWMYLLEKLPSIDENTNAVYYVHTGGLTGIESQLKRYESVACKA